MSLNDNVYSMPEDIENAEREQQERNEGKRVAIRILDLMNRSQPVIAPDQTTLRLLCLAAKESGLDTKRVEDLEAHCRRISELLSETERRLDAAHLENGIIHDELRRESNTVNRLADEERRAKSTINSLSEENMELQADIKALKRVLALYVKVSNV